MALKKNGGKKFDSNQVTKLLSYKFNFFQIMSCHMSSSEFEKKTQLIGALLVVKTFPITFIALDS